MGLTSPRRASSTEPGRRLRTYRQAAGLTQEQVADRSGLSVRAVRDLESGVTRRPRAGSLDRIADVLQLSADQRHELRSGYATDAGASVGILGPLRVSPEEIHTPMLRNLLGVLALYAPGWVGRSTVVDALWGDAPPDSATSLLNVYIGQLRKRIDAVHRIGDRYRLDLPTERFDAAMFAVRLAAAERDSAEGRPAEAYAAYGAALDCWRGRVLADLHERLSGHPGAIALSGRRIEAALAYGELAIALDRHADAAVKVAAVADAEPLHEALGALLVRLLSGAGEQAAALRRYFGLRDRLDAELGVEPGEALRTAYVQALGPALPRVAGDGPAAVPAQLPAPVAGFTGRRTELDWLSGALASTRVVAICGPAGAGKTALALQWGHRIIDRVPDGQLYVNLRGYDPGAPMPVSEALGRLLRGVGVQPSQTPADADEAAALYRGLVAGRRLLVVLDNALDANQVRPLLPGGDGGECSPLVVVTSRNRLAGLVALDGARSLRLAALPPAEARQLLTCLLGPDVRGDLDGLVRACGGLPLALRIAAAAALDEPGGDVAGYTARLRSAPLDELELCGEEQVDVRAAFNCSYVRLPESARATLRLLGCVPSGRFDRGLAIHLAGDRAAAGVTQLVTAHLLDEPARGRYAFHDLIREYAAERLAAEESREARATVVHRLVDWYLAVAAAANAVISPHLRLVQPTIEYPPRELPFDGTRAGALAYLAGESDQIAGVVRLAADAGHGQSAWHMVYLLLGYLDLGTNVAQSVEISGLGVDIAVRLGDVTAERVMRNGHAAMCNTGGLPQRALDTLRDVVSLARDAGSVRGEATAHNSIGRALRQLGRPAEAVEAYTRALALYERLGDADDVATVLNNLGNAYVDCGLHGPALEILHRALAHRTRHGAPADRALPLTSLGQLHFTLGDFAAAEPLLREALALAREYQLRELETGLLIRIGRLGMATGRTDEAVADLVVALSMSRENSLPRFEEAALAALEGVPVNCP